ncbi:MAG: large conductance mechanosensitive channel protein MscL [Candidatus Latescibacterota bacterium]|nr:MAG: large conductance mechanosensitive channel protein MscL [Candidatus Latescibacterota bacterium]
MVREFKKFALRGSLIDLAVGFTVGAAFTTIVKSLVGDIIMPPIGLLIGRADFANFFLLLKSGSKAAPYATLGDAQSVGAVTINYGVFLNNLMAFLIVALTMFFVVRLINRVDTKLEEEFGKEKPKAGDPTEKKCPYCLSTIAFKATRCPACTSQLKTVGEAGSA